MGRPELSFRNQLLWPFIVLPALAVGARFGVTGVALAWALSFPILFAISSRRIAIALQISWPTLIGPLLRPAIAAGIMALVVWAIDISVAHRLADYARLIIATIVGLVTYVAMLRAIAPTAFEETTAFMFRFLGRQVAAPEH